MEDQPPPPSSFFRTLKDRLVSTGIEFALLSFWGVVVGAILAFIATSWAVFRGLEEKWVYAFGGAFFAFVFVLAVTSAIQWVKRRNERPRRTGQKGVFNYLVDRDQSLRAVRASLQEMTREMGEVGRVINKQRPRIDAIQNRGGERVPEELYKLQRRLARKLTKRAVLMEIHARRLADNVDLLASSLSKWLSWLSQHHTQVKDKNEFRESVVQLRTVVHSGGIPPFQKFRDTLANIRTLSDQMDLAGERLMGVTDSVIESMKRVIKLCDDTIAQLDREQYDT